MNSQRTCPECHLTFGADVPATGVLVCPLCNSAFSPPPPAGSAPAIVPPPATSGRQVLRGVAAVGTILFLVGGLGYAYYLMNDLGRKPVPAPDPTPSAPSITESLQPIEIIPYIPVEPKPNTTVLKPKSPSPPAEPKVTEPGPKSVSQPAEPRPFVDPEASRPLTLAERVNRAIDRGVEFLKARHGEPKQYRNYLALLGLTLLECGVSADDPAVRQIAGWVRASERQITQTYELTLAILFLDRLGAERDRDLIRSFGERLLAGQLECGAWTYSCLMTDRPGIGASAKRPGPARMPNGIPIIPPLPAWQDNRRPAGRIPRQRVAYRGDNSNTQFAILGLWVAQRHAVPSRNALLATAQYFRDTQQSDGSWAYHANASNWRDSMTCAALMSLAMRYGVVGGQARDIRPKQAIQVRDAAVDRGLGYLAQALGRITRTGNRIDGVDARDPLYFLWSLERMAVIYDLKKLGQREWYPWAAEMLVEIQNPVGGWPGSNPVATCFALLILKRSNFAQDLQLVVKEPAPPPMPSTTRPIILQGADALLGQTTKPPDPPAMPGTTAPSKSSPPLGPSISRTPNAK